MPPVAAAPRADAIDYEALARDLDARANRDQTVVGPRRVTFGAVGVRESCPDYSVSVLRPLEGMANRSATKGWCSLSFRRARG